MDEISVPSDEIEKKISMPENFLQEFELTQKFRIGPDRRTKIFVVFEVKFLYAFKYGGEDVLGESRGRGCSRGE